MYIYTTVIIHHVRVCCIRTMYMLYLGKVMMLRMFNDK